MLTDKQERFCLEYIIDTNATQAYIRAGYSPKGANALAARMIAKDSIRARIDELLAEKDAALIAKGDEVLQTLTRILRREEDETTVVVCSRRIPVIDDDGKTRYTTIEEPQVVTLKPRLSDVNRAAELLAKRYGLLTDNINLDARLPVLVDDVPKGDAP